MAKATLIRQLVVITPNDVGMLANVCEAICKCGNAVTHVCASALGDDARFMLNVDNPEAVKQSLEEAGYEVSLADVLEIEFENAPDVLAPVARALSAAGVDILFNYGTSADGKKAVLIMSTNDDLRALEIINGRVS